MLYNFWLVDDKKNGDLSIEFKAPRFYEVEGRNLPSRLLVAFELGEYHFEPGDVYTVVLTDITDAEDDYLGAEETTGTVAVGGSVTGNLEVDNDVDWFKVRLEEGKSYRIRMRGSESGGGTLADPFVAIGTVTSFSAGYYGFGLPVPAQRRQEHDGERQRTGCPCIYHTRRLHSRCHVRHGHGHLHHRGGGGAKHAEPEGEQPGDGRARHHRDGAGRRDADRDHRRHRGRGRSDRRGVRLPMGPLRRRHRGSGKLHLHRDRRRRGQTHPGAGHLHRRCGQRRVADQLREAVRPALDHPR